MNFPPEVAVLGLSIGLVFSLICYLVSNLSPGGMITPPWLALLLIDDPRRAGIVVAVIGATYVVMRFVQRVVILYGKRLFAAVVLCAVFLQVTVSLFLIDLFPTLFATTTLGFIVPGLVAYQLIRQPIIPTVLATSLVTLGTWAVLLSGILLRFIPNA